MMHEPTVVVGRITRAHGVTGEVAVLVISEVPGRFDDGATVWLEDGRTLIVESDRKSTRLNSSHRRLSRMPSSA